MRYQGVSLGDQIFMIIRRKGPLSISDIAHDLQMRSEDLEAVIKHLCDAGIIAKSQSEPGEPELWTLPNSK